MDRTQAQRIADIVNSECERTTDIIKAVECEHCNEYFFTQPQDKMFRDANSYKTLCPACRKEETKEKKRNFAKKKRIERSEVEILNSQLRYIANGHMREKDFYTRIHRASKVNQNTIHVITNSGEYKLCDIHNMYDEEHGYVKDNSGIPFKELEEKYGNNEEESN